MKELTKLQRLVSWIIYHTNWLWAHRLENRLIVRSLNVGYKHFNPSAERMVIETMNKADEQKWLAGK